MNQLSRNTTISGSVLQDSQTTNTNHATMLDSKTYYFPKYDQMDSKDHINGLDKDNAQEITMDVQHNANSSGCLIQ